MQDHKIISTMSTKLTSSPECEDEARCMPENMDPYLNYFALGLLVFIIIIMFYVVIAIHDIPARIAESRHHPHADAIHAAGWVSLLTLHVLWPFLWIWAMAYRPERGWGFSTPGQQTPGQEAALANRLHWLLAYAWYREPLPRHAQAY